MSDLSQPNQNELVPSVTTDNTADPQSLEAWIKELKRAAHCGCEAAYMHRADCKMPDALKIISELQQELKEAHDSECALDLKLRALAPHGTCGCSYDKPGEVCMHHSPKVQELQAREKELVEALRETLKYGFVPRATLETIKRLLAKEPQ